MTINDLLIGKTIIDIRVIRGLGIIPARFEIELLQNEKKYVIETEVNFRFIYRGKLVMCFDDLYLNTKYEEISLKKYREQKNIENTLLYVNINNALKKIKGKQIRKVVVSKFGDINFFMSKNSKIQIINDTHLNESCILRIFDNNTFETIVTDNDKKFNINRTIMEFKNINGNIVFLNYLI